MNLYAFYLIKLYEGCSLIAYRDIADILTIGYGHTGPEVTENMVITQQEADDLLMKDLKEFEAGVTKLIKVELTDAQLGALIDFAFNLGLNALERSTLLKKVNRHDPSAADEFLRWYYVNGKRIKGLLRRRTEERKLFINKK